MSCTHPIFALDFGEVDGKRKIKLVPYRADCYSLERLEEKYGKARVLALPCGKCLDCLLSYSRTWAVRCCLEASLYDYNYFVTLTYSDAPDRLCRRDVQLFLKKLRKKYPGVRYFGCGEYGDHNNRPHYHLILFNLPLDDIKFLGTSKGCRFYKSSFLEKCWSYGLVDIGEVTFNSAGYVARYAMKKLKAEKRDEFLMMSLKPGIGRVWFEQHKDIIADYDKIYFNFGKVNKVSPPRYFDKVLESLDHHI